MNTIGENDEDHRGQQASLKKASICGLGYFGPMGWYLAKIPPGKRPSFVRKFKIVGWAMSQELERGRNVSMIITSSIILKNSQVWCWQWGM
jgi:hypothetical protein